MVVSDSTLFEASSFDQISQDYSVVQACIDSIYSLFLDLFFKTVTFIGGCIYWDYDTVQFLWIYSMDCQSCLWQ